MEQEQTIEMKLCLFLAGRLRYALRLRRAFKGTDMEGQMWAQWAEAHNAYYGAKEICVEHGCWPQKEDS